MAKFWKTPQFDNLKREWDKRLSELGFEDAEKTICGESVLKQAADYAYRRKETVEVIRYNKLEYFSLVSSFVCKESSFEDESDRLIMERTAEGWTIQEISRELKAHKMHKSNRDTIRYIRRRYEHKWGIRVWKAFQMVSRRVPTRS